MHSVRVSLSCDVIQQKVNIIRVHLTCDLVHAYIMLIYL